MADYFAESLPDAEIPMSAVQSFLIRHADSADDALMELDELTNWSAGSPQFAEA